MKYMETSEDITDMGCWGLIIPHTCILDSHVSLVLWLRMFAKYPMHTGPLTTFPVLAIGSIFMCHYSIVRILFCRHLFIFIC